MGKALTVGLTVPLMGIAAASVKVGNEFQAQMSRVQAISGATAGQLTKMKDQAIQLGAQTAFSAKEAAQGMENLASAGFLVKEIMDAMPGVLDLAAVSGGDVAASSESMASSLRAFGLEATQAGHVADVFARAAADTNAETGDMAEAMKYIAPVAHAMGLSLEETAASIGIMADAGIKGSQAGTTLRGALSRIARPTKAMTKSMEELGISFYDANGNMIPLREQISQLKSATAGLTQEERNRHLVTLYGQESLSGMLALLDAGPEKLDKMTQTLINSDGAAAQMAATMQDNLASKIEQMFGAMESAGIIIQQILEPMLAKVVGGITRLIEAFVNMSPLGQKMIVIFAGMVAALGPLLVIAGVAISTLCAFNSADKSRKP
jgi:TP901 family phage tail tape measure protein